MDIPFWMVIESLQRSMGAGNLNSLSLSGLLVSNVYPPTQMARQI